MKQWLLKFHMKRFIIWIGLQYIDNYGALAQLGERYAGSVEVTGSSPVCSIQKSLNPLPFRRIKAFYIQFTVIGSAISIADALIDALKQGQVLNFTLIKFFPNP
jgi:hypothetical protein